MTSCTRAGRPLGDPMTEALPIVPAPVTVPGTLSILAIQGVVIFPEMVSPIPAAEGRGRDPKGEILIRGRLKHYVKANLARFKVPA